MECSSQAPRAPSEPGSSRSSWSGGTRSSAPPAPRSGPRDSRAGRRAGRARPARPGRGACRRSRCASGRDRPPGNRARGGLDTRHFDRASLRPTGCAPRARTHCWPRRGGRRPALPRQSFAGWPSARERRAREDRGRPARPQNPLPGMRETLDAIRHLEDRSSGPAASPSATAASTARRTTPARARTEAEVPGRRGRRRRLVVRPPRRRRGRDGARARARRARRSTTWSTTSPAPVRECYPRSPRRRGEAAEARPAWLARALAGDVGVDPHDPDAGRLERQGEARARLDASLPELETGLPGGLPEPAGRRVAAAQPTAPTGGELPHCSSPPLGLGLPSPRRKSEGLWTGVSPWG